MGKGNGNGKAPVLGCGMSVLQKKRPVAQRQFACVWLQPSTSGFQSLGSGWFFRSPAFFWNPAETFAGFRFSIFLSAQRRIRVYYTYKYTLWTRNIGTTSTTRPYQWFRTSKHFAGYGFPRLQRKFIIANSKQIQKGTRKTPRVGKSKCVGHDLLFKKNHTLHATRPKCTEFLIASVSQIFLQYH